MNINVHTKLILVTKIPVLVTATVNELPGQYFFKMPSDHLLLSVFFIVLLKVNYSTLSTSEPVHVKFISPTHSHYLSETTLNKYHTLDYWISNGSTELFANNTKAVLFSGIHEIQFSKTYVLITNINLFTMTGQKGNDTFITCSKRFYFHFLLVQNIELANFTITNCTYILNDMTYKNAPLFSVFHQIDIFGNTEFSFVFSDSHNVTIMGISVVNRGGVFIHHNTFNQRDQLQAYKTSTVNFLNNKVKILSGVGLGFVLPKRILLPIFNLTIINNALHHACLLLRVASRSDISVDVSIKNMSIHSPECEAFHVLTATVLRDTYFQDIVITHGNHQREAYFVATAQSVTINGNLTIQYNRYGDTWISACNVTITPKSVLAFAFNDFQWQFTFRKLFSISLTCSKSYLKVESSTLVFKNNQVLRGKIFQIQGGTSVISTSIITFTNNTCQSKDDDPLKSTVFMLKAAEMVEIIDSELMFMNNSASHLSGGLTMIKGSQIYCDQCKLEFYGNKGGDGGAMSFYGKSQIRFAKQTCLCLKFENNRARNKGGAIYVEDSDYLNLQDMKRFYEYGYSGDYISDVKYGNITTYFNGNLAEVAGNDLYGGWIDQRQFFIDTIWPSQSVDFQSIASDPVRVCINVNFSAQCSLNKYETQSIPGDVLNIHLVAVGQRYGIVPAKVLVSSFMGGIYKQESVYSVERRYSYLQVPVKTNKSILVLQVSPEGSTERIGRISWSAKETLRLSSYKNILNQLQIVVHIDACPLGFKLDSNAGVCVCLESGDNPRYTCNVTSFQVIIPVQKWINASFVHVAPNTSYGVIVHNHCPYDYCKSINGPQSISNPIINALFFALEYYVVNVSLDSAICWDRHSAENAPVTGCLLLYLVLLSQEYCLL